LSTVNLVKQTFNETVADNDIVLIDFWAEWCGPCRTFGPVFEKVSSDFPDVVFAKVDTEDQQALAASFNITSIPTLMAIRDKVVLFSQAGALPEAHLRDLVQKVRDLDMDDVKAQIAQQGNAGSSDTE
jgi:thioredoxin 1